MRARKPRAFSRSLDGGIENVAGKVDPLARRKIGMHDCDARRAQRREQLPLDMRLQFLPQRTIAGAEIEQRRNVLPDRQDFAQASGFGVEHPREEPRAS